MQFPLGNALITITFVKERNTYSSCVLPIFFADDPISETLKKPDCSLQESVIIFENYS